MLKFCVSVYYLSNMYKVLTFYLSAMEALAPREYKYSPEDEKAIHIIGIMDRWIDLQTWNDQSKFTRMTGWLKL